MTWGLAGDSVPAPPRGLNGSMNLTSPGAEHFGVAPQAVPSWAVASLATTFVYSQGGSLTEATPVPTRGWLALSAQCTFQPSTRRHAQGQRPGPAEPEEQVASLVSGLLVRNISIWEFGFQRRLVTIFKT